MAKSFLLAVVACALISGAHGQGTAPLYGQCGGEGYTGPTQCVAGAHCQATNQWYSQCIPGAATTSAPATTISTTTTVTPLPTTPTTSTPTQTFSTPSAPSGTPTLVSGYSFVRAVVDPNFHKYLRSEVWGTPGDAVLGDYMTASLLRVSNGQLIQGVDGKQTLLYGRVEARANSSVMRLKLSWATSPPTAGKFVFSGDTLEWSDPAISRPQNNAWLVCADPQGNRDVYVNLGPYSYQTPAGCADQTIHAYTGPVSVP